MSQEDIDSAVDGFVMGNIDIIRPLVTKLMELELNADGAPALSSFVGVGLGGGLGTAKIQTEWGGGANDILFQNLAPGSAEAAVIYAGPDAYNTDVPDTTATWNPLNVWIVVALAGFHWVQFDTGLVLARTTQLDTQAAGDTFHFINDDTIPDQIDWEFLNGITIRYKTGATGQDLVDWAATNPFDLSDSDQLHEILTIALSLGADGSTGLSDGDFTFVDQETITATAADVKSAIDSIMDSLPDELQFSSTLQNDDGTPTDGSGVIPNTSNFYLTGGQDGISGNGKNGINFNDDDPNTYVVCDLFTEDEFDN